jgi:hypothetical protein
MLNKYIIAVQIQELPGHQLFCVLDAGTREHQVEGCACTHLDILNNWAEPKTAGPVRPLTTGNNLNAG